MAGRTRTARGGSGTLERPRGVVRAFGRTPAPAVSFDVRTAYDFVISLSGMTEAGDEILPDHRAWLSASREALAADPSVADIPPSIWELSWTAGMLAVDRPEVRSGVDLLALVESSSPVLISRVLFTDELADPAIRPLVERGLAGDEAATVALEARIAGDDETVGAWCLTERMDAIRHPERFKAELVRLLQAWVPRFAAVEPEVGAMLERDVAMRRDDVERLSPFDLVERVTEGIRTVPEPGVRRIVLAPTYFGRPYNHLLTGDDFRFYAYPILDAAIETLDPTAPPVSLERFHRALGDSSRLRIVKLLSDRDWYLTELAVELGLSKPTVKHHLAQLRAAGLATVTEEGALMYWSLRRERLAEAAEELRRYLA